jgi:hypothetical protein
MIYIGIDPGVTGAMAIIWPDLSWKQGKDISIYPFGDQCLKWLQLNKSCDESRHKVAVIEKQQPYHKQGVKSVGTLMENYGRWIGWLEMAGIPFEIKTPQEWKKVMLSGSPARPARIGAINKELKEFKSDILILKKEMKNPKGPTQWYKSQIIECQDAIETGNKEKQRLIYTHKKALKDYAIETVQHLFPTVNLIPDGCSVEHDGMAEALLIAEYCRRITK